MKDFWKNLKALPTKDKVLLPWRLMWLIIAQVFRVGFWFCVFAAMGWRDAKRAWRDTTR